MAMKIRLARGGSKKRPHYRIVAADSRMPRDGRYIERLGTYDPLLPKDSEDRVKMNVERIQYWMGQGAEPTDRVSRFLEAAGIVEKKERSNPQRGQSPAKRRRYVPRKRPPRPPMQPKPRPHQQKNLPLKRPRLKRPRLKTKRLNRRQPRIAGRQCSRSRGRTSRRTCR